MPQESCYNGGIVDAAITANIVRSETCYANKKSVHENYRVILVRHQRSVLKLLQFVVDMESLFRESHGGCSKNLFIYQNSVNYGYKYDVVLLFFWSVVLLPALTFLP